MEKVREKISGILDGLYHGFSIVHFMPTAYRKGLHHIAEKAEFRMDDKTPYSLYTTAIISLGGFIGYSYAMLNEIRSLYFIPVCTNLFSLLHELIDKPMNEEGKTLENLIKERFSELFRNDDFNKFRLS